MRPLALRPLLAIAAAQVALHVATSDRYGVFIDELYYVACGEHLAWGYVDHPPLIALVAWIGRTIGGESLLALRFLPACAGAAAAFAAGALARVLGGGRLAQLVAAGATAFAPPVLFLHHILSVNAFDVLWWALAALQTARILERPTPRRWLVLGLVVGIGLMTKLSMAMFVVGLGAGLVLTPSRRLLASPWPWAAGAVALCVVLPHLVWQAAHGFPTLEWMKNAAVLKNRALSPLGFLLGHVMEVSPPFFALVVVGLVALWRSGRVFFWLYLVVFAVFAATNGKPYYVTPTLAIVFAGAGVGLERFLVRTWARVATVGALAVAAILIMPFGLPVLPVDAYVRWQGIILGGALPSSERKSVGRLPQHFADMHGHEELAALAAEVYHSLPDAERQRTDIWGVSYAQAGAVDYYRARYRLPRATSGHNSYFLWGPGERDVSTLILLGGNPDDHRQSCGDLSLARVFRHPLAMPWRNQLPIWICRDLRRPFADIWPSVKHYE